MILNSHVIFKLIFYIAVRPRFRKLDVTFWNWNFLTRFLVQTFLVAAVYNEDPRRRYLRFSQTAELRKQKFNN